MSKDTKTILTCDTKDFLRQMNAIRHDVERFFKDTEINTVIYNQPDIPADDKEREKKLLAVYNERFNKMVSCFGENIEKTYALLTKMCFGNAEYVNGLNEMEVITLLMKMLTDGRVIPFFITLQPSEQQNSDG